MSKYQEALDRISTNFGECDVGSRYYDLELHKDIATLQKLVDIEEQIEMDLITLFEVYNKLCEQKFVYMKIGYQIKCFEYNHYVIDFKNKEIIGIEYEPDIWLSFKDYGIIWALNREGLV